MYLDPVRELRNVQKVLAEVLLKLRLIQCLRFNDKSSELRATDIRRGLDLTLKQLGLLTLCMLLDV